MKKVLCLMMALCLVLSLAACGQSNLNVVTTALNKNSDAKSMSYKAKVKGDFTLEGLDDLLATSSVPADQLETMLNQMKITMEGNIVSGDKKDQAQTEMGVSINIMGMALEMKMWSRFLDDGKTMETIMKSPELPGLVASEKPYTVSRTTIEGPDVEKTEQFTKVINDFIIDNTKDEKFLTKIEKNHYKITVSKEKCEALLEEIINQLVASSDGLASTAGVDVEANMDKVKKIIPLLIGEKGVEIEVVINDEGYVSKQTIKIDVNLDLAKIAEAMGEDVAGVTGKIGMNLEIDMEYSDFNAVEEIEFPEINEDNAIINEF